MKYREEFVVIKKVFYVKILLFKILIYDKNRPNYCQDGVNIYQPKSLLSILSVNPLRVGDLISFLVDFCFWVASNDAAANVENAIFVSVSVLIFLILQ